MPVKALRDLMHEQVERVRIDSAETHAEVLGFVQRFIPEWAPRIEQYGSERPIFDLYGIDDEIDQALQRRTPLKSGGHLVIDQTEAMTTIDVNTGAFVGHRTLEETIYKTNLEAAQAIARQLRLRNLGGIIIIDFIDMHDEAHKRQVMRTLEKALEKDHARTTVCELSSLGLVEMTRKRSSESLGHMLCEPCPVCSGRGNVKSVETVCLEVFREIMRSGRQFEASKMMVMAAPAVVNRVLDDFSATVADLEELTGKSIRFQAEEQYTQEQFDVVLL
jgi:ribonuclease G